MTSTQRTQLLAAVALILVIGLGLERVLSHRGPTGATSSGGDAVASVGTPALVGAPPGLDAKGLQERYATVIQVQPFAERSFRPQPARRDRPAPRQVRREPSAPPPPSKLELRLTGLLGQGEGRVGVLEERASGKGILAHPGLELGPVAISAVGTESITLAEGEKRRELALGDALELPLEVSSQLVALKTTTTETSAAPSGGGRRRGSSAGARATPVPQVSSEDRQKILERLRARRARSLKSDDPKEESQ